MLRGDLATMPLADLLQWVDAARKNVVVELEREGGMRAWIVAVDRAVVTTSMPLARGSLAGDAGGGQSPGLRAAAIEGLLDLFFQSEGTFTLREGTSAPGPGVAVEVQLGFLVMEALRQLDEWPRLEATYPDDGARLRATSGADGARDAAELSVVQSAIHRAAREGRTLGELRLVLGLSRHALLRRVDELRGIGLCELEGAGGAEGAGAVAAGPDLPSKLREQAIALARERQYAEAAHVLRSLLATVPDDRTLRRLLEQTEREHVASCYETISKSDLVQLAGGARAGGAPSIAPGAEQAIVEALAQKPRSVAALVLVSPLRELETLVGILRLAKRGIVEIERTG